MRARGRRRHVAGATIRPPRLACGYTPCMSATDTPVAAGRVSLPAAVVDLSRGRQALLSIAQPALGAMLAAGGLPAAWRIGVGLVAAASGYLAVFSLNDVLDRRVDEAALEHTREDDALFDLDTVAVRHPLARGDLSMAASLTWVVSLGVLSAACAWLLAPICLALFAAAVALEVAYCSLRSVTWAKTFVSGLMVAVGGLAGWAAVAPLTASAATLFAFLALWEIAGRNLPNDLADVRADSAVGIRTVATVFGARASAWATLVGAAATLVAIGLLPASPLLRVAWAGLALYAMVAPGPSPCPPPRQRRGGVLLQPGQPPAGAHVRRRARVPGDRVLKVEQADAEVRELFDRNAATYDRVNTAISLGLDARWRGWAARRAVVRRGARVLDAFAGTGLVGLRAASLGAEVTLADESRGMLAIAEERARREGLDVRVVRTDLAAEPLAVPGAPFDAITMVFGARYLEDPVRVVGSLSRLLRDGGTLVLVDFVQPRPSVLSRLAGFYFFHVLPRLAGALAGHRELYDRLVTSTRAMGPPENLVRIALKAGLDVTETRAMGFGLVLGLVAQRE